MTTEDAKTFLANRQIPRLFESLMTGLMFHRPSDHIQYLIDCLEKVREKGPDTVSWNSFVDIKRNKTPLPPITPQNGRRPHSNQRSRTPRKESSPTDLRKSPSPLPPIGTAKIEIQDVPIVLVMGGPGCGKYTQVKTLVDRYKGWVHLSMGDIIRNEVAQKGSAEEKWEMVGNLVSKGEMAPEDVTVDLLIRNLKAHPDAAGFIIEGYPRDLRQMKEYERSIGRVDLVFVLDCEEYYLSQRLMKRGAETGRVDDNLNAIAKRITFFKQNTLPVVKEYDDQGKLVIIDGDRDGDVIGFDLALLFDTTFYGRKSSKVDYGNNQSMAEPSPRPPSSGTPRVRSARRRTPVQMASRQGTITDEPPIPVGLGAADIVNPDTGRKEGLPQCPIFIVAGGPGSGKGMQCKKILERYPDFVHLSMGEILRDEIAKKGSAEDIWNMVGTLIEKGEMAPEDVTVELLIDSIKKHQDAEAIVLEGYPRDNNQVEEFNKNVGGVSFVLLLDCEEEFLQKRLLDREQSSGRIDDNASAISSRLTLFKNNTLPVLKYYDDQGILFVVNGERDSDDISSNIYQIIETELSEKKQTRMESPQEKPVREEVIEESAVQEQANVTGDDNGNALYTEELNKLSERNYEEGEKEEIRHDLPPFPCNMKPADINVKDEGRKSGLPDCPIILFAGAPGSDKGTQCKRITESYKDVVHLSMDDMIDTLDRKGEMLTEEVIAELLVNSIKSNSDAEAIIIEGYPIDSRQVDEFNKNVGGALFVLLLDTVENCTQTRRDSDPIDDNLNSIQSRLTFYKINTLPVLKHYDDQQKLVVIKGDRDPDIIFSDICSLLDGALSGKKSEGEQGRSKSPERSDDKAAALKKLGAGFKGKYTRQHKRGGRKSPERSPERSDDKAAALTKLGAGFKGKYTRQNKRERHSRPKSPESPKHSNDKAATDKLAAGFKGKYARHNKKAKA